MSSRAPSRSHHARPRGRRLILSDPPEYGLYVPTAQGTFSCLDGSKVIPFKAINDDYCDCPDGSDEPGAPFLCQASFYSALQLKLMAGDLSPQEHLLVPTAPFSAQTRDTYPARSSRAE